MMFNIIVILLLLFLCVIGVINLIVSVSNKFETEEIINGINYIIKGKQNGSGNSKNQD